MKIVLILLAIFCFLHAYRDYLQIKGVKNWFTQIGHFWDEPKYEKFSMVIFGVLGIVCLLISEKLL